MGILGVRENSEGLEISRYLGIFEFLWVLNSTSNKGCAIYLDDHIATSFNLCPTTNVGEGTSAQLSDVGIVFHILQQDCVFENNR